MTGTGSSGFLLAALHKEGEERLNLLRPDRHIPAGTKLYGTGEYPSCCMAENSAAQAKAQAILFQAYEMDLINAHLIKMLTGQSNRSIMKTEISREMRYHEWSDYYSRMNNIVRISETLQRRSKGRE